MMSIQEKQKSGFYGVHICVSKENYKILESMAGYRDTMNSVVTRLIEKAAIVRVIENGNTNSKSK